MKRLGRRATALLMAAALALSATGCWGKRELTELFFVTGIAIDTADAPDEFAFTLQVGKTQAASSEGSDSGSEEAALILTATEKTMSEAVNTINRNASRQVFIHHNQVILFGESLAREGLDDHIDIFMRDQESRMEVPIAVVAGNAADLLAQEMEQDKVTGSYLARMFNSRASISPNYKVAILDFASRLLEKSVAPVAPLLTLVESGDKAAIDIAGMAVFKGSKMVGTLDNDEVLGYIWALGDVKGSRVAAQTDQGRAVYKIETLDTDTEVEITDDGGIRVTLAVDANLLLDEMAGFVEIPEKDLVDYLSGIAAEEIKSRIAATFEAARAMDADIYGFGLNIYRHQPKKWHEIEDDWDALFQGITLDVQVTTHIPSTGKVIKSIEMEEQK